jgi:hypothetical protein
MKRISLLVTVMTLLFISAKAQPHAAIFAEIGGPGIASINFDTRFSSRNDGIGGKIGVGGFSIDETRALYVPVALNYLIGKGNKHFFEIGAGFTYVDFRDDDIYSDENGLFERNFGHIHLGYRIQPQDGGFLFRAAIIPVFGNGNFLPYYAGVSFGYKF